MCVIAMFVKIDVIKIYVNPWGMEISNMIVINFCNSDGWLAVEGLPVISVLHKFDWTKRMV